MAPSLVQAFIPTIPNYNAGLDLAIARTGTVSVAQAQEAPAYNAKGEPTADSRFRYVFNAFGWLTSATNLVAEPASYVAFAYDTGGRRIKKTVYERNGAAWVEKTRHQFYYDGWNLVAETVTDKTVTPESTTLRLYTWGLDLVGQRGGRLGQSVGGIGGLLAITEIDGTVTNVYYPVSDHIGTIRALVDAKSGETVAEYEYDPYGVLLEEAGEKADACPFRFSSKYYDRETQLLYFGYRYYSPASTKWLTVDPLQERGGLNFTAYCGGDPVNNIDPLGLSFLSWLLGCGWNTEEARAFDDYLHEDYWGGDFSRRGIAAINAELKMAVGAVEALGGAKLTALSGGLAAAGGYALVADGSSWMSGGAGDYLNLFRDDDLPDYDVVGVGFRQMAGTTWGPVARSACTMGLSMGAPVLAQQQMNAALTAEAQAIRLQSQSAATEKNRTPPIPLTENFD